MLEAHRENIRSAIRQDEAIALKRLLTLADLSQQDRASISTHAAGLVRSIRDTSNPGLMEVFLEEYGLSTDEGIALMCLAEALLRVPDADTIDALIEDKIAPSDWGKHLGQSSSSLVNASTWALMLTGRVLDEPTGLAGTLHNVIKRVGEPVIRTAVSRAMKEMGRQFVLGQNIDDAMERAKGMEAKGFTYSYDMLGEAARTEADARRYHLAYSEAITAIAHNAKSDDIRENPGISVKLSALHPRYEFAQRDRIMNELVPRTRSLASLAKSAGMGFNIDAEEANRLDLSLDVIKAVLEDPSLEGWDGFGIVVQAYGPRASHVIDWLYEMSGAIDRKIMVRLVKGAYWDTEIRQAQIDGLDGFPVFTRKASTDLSYIANARKLLEMTDRIYPQFATHNAHSVAAILHMAHDKSSFELQRLHGMGEALHTNILETEGTKCRIYAPVGAHRDLLAYLVRRLLENGANSSFVNQIVDKDVAPEEVAADPITEVEHYLASPQNPAIALPSRIFPGRKNARGWDVSDPSAMEALFQEMEPFRSKTYSGSTAYSGDIVEIRNPAKPGDLVGTVRHASRADVDAAFKAAELWGAPDRADILRKAADLYEENAPEIFTLLTREAGKTLLDAIAELREAVDFLRYYAEQSNALDNPPLGTFACISPWNFPLAIFTGQISAALAAGNAVLAKPAEATPLVAKFAVSLLHKAGVPANSLRLIPGFGREVGASLAGHGDLGGLAFTGSTTTAQIINRTMAEHAPHAPLIAETGGINAMIVDSTALPEQAIRDILTSAFQSAGQRCSALRCLYVQEDIAEPFKEMLFGAMDELIVGDPAYLSTDVGPVIDKAAQTRIQTHIDAAITAGHLLHSTNIPKDGTFIAPTVIKVTGIKDIREEIFGPVLHIATFSSGEIDQIVDDINDTGFGLTFGLHTRIDDRVEQIVSRLKVGNAYVNRNQIGAIVGSQPFGGEGLSGTGPKAGGPHYLPRFSRADSPQLSPAMHPDASEHDPFPKNAAISPPLQTTDLPGPTGESNRLSVHPKGNVLCLGPNAAAQKAEAEAEGCTARIAEGLAPETLTALPNIDAVVYWGQGPRPYRQTLAARDGVIIPLITSRGDPTRYHLERHLCIDTTASGGNTDLLAAADPD